VVTQVKQVILVSINDTTEVTPNMSTTSPSVTYEVVSDVFDDNGKTMKNQIQQMLVEGLAKSFRNLDIPFDSPTLHVG
jgi:hypothetical protein